MNVVNDTGATNRYNYITNTKWKTASERLAVLFFIAVFIMPAYFGFQIGGFDVTMLRLFSGIMVLFIYEKKIRTEEFKQVLIDCPVNVPVIMYMIVVIYTSVIRNSINTLVSQFFEVIIIYLMAYAFTYGLGFKRSFRIIIISLYVLCILGLIEYVIGRPLFSFLETIPGVYSGVTARNGTYRISGPCTVHLGYGLLLVANTPLACYKEDSKELNVFDRPILLLLLFANVLLTGSRSSLAFFIVEIAIMFVFSTRKYVKRNILYLIIFIMFFTVFTFALSHTSIGIYILRSITAVIDSVFDTSFSVKYGGDVYLMYSSKNYRDAVLGAFSLSVLNPLVGLGTNQSIVFDYNGYHIESIDNFYICQYIFLGYPGMITYILLITTAAFHFLRSFIRKNPLSLAVLVGFVTYYVHLWYVAHLMTLKYTFILIALYMAYTHEENVHPD